MSERCSRCGKEIIATEEGYFVEGEAIYCEKCYADKRWNEMDPKSKALWRLNMLKIWRAWINSAVDEEEKRKRRELVIRLKIPKDLEGEI